MSRAAEYLDEVFGAALDEDVFCATARGVREREVILCDARSVMQVCSARVVSMGVRMAMRRRDMPG